jgi:hypothetical protein
MSTYVSDRPVSAGDEVLATACGALLDPPAPHGDVYRLNTGRGDAAVIIDGYRHGRAVRHKELLGLVLEVVRAIGWSSTGASHAAESSSYRTIGRGAVSDIFRTRIPDTDEVAAAHGEVPEFRASEICR